MAVQIHASAPPYEQQADTSSEEAGRQRGRQFKDTIRTVSRGCAVIGTKMLKPIAWIETQVVKITVDNTEYSGRFRSRILLGEKDEYRAWVTTQENPSITRYFQSQRSSSLPANVLGHIKTGVENVHYFSDEELTHFEVVVKGQTLYTRGTLLSDWKSKVDKIPETGNVRFASFLQGRQHSHTELTAVPDGEFIYVLTHDGRFYLIPVKDGEMHHTSISRGNAISGAGSIWIKDKKVRKIDNASGHYHPKVCQLMNVLENIEAKGISPDSYSITYMTKENEKRVFTDISLGEGKEWMRTQKTHLLKKLAAHHVHAEDIPYALLERAALHKK